MSCVNDSNCGDRENCFFESNGAINGTCDCSIFLGWDGEDCAELRRGHLLYSILGHGFKIITTLALLFRAIYIERRMFKSLPREKGNPIFFSWRCTVASLLFLLTHGLLSIGLFLSPQGYVGFPSRTGVKVDKRGFFTDTLLLPAYFFLYAVNLNTGLLWMENAKKIETLNPFLRSDPLADKIKKFHRIQFIAIIFLLLLLFYLDQAAYCAVVILLDGLLIGGGVHILAASKFLKGLRATKYITKHTGAYRMVLQLSFITVFSFLVEGVGIALFLYATLEADILEEGEFASVFLAKEVVSWAALLNLYGNQRYLHQTIVGAARFNGKETYKAMHNIADSQTPGATTTTGEERNRGLSY